MANGEFDIFCRSVVGKKGWFPKMETSVELIDYTLSSGRGRCRIIRQTGEDRKHCILHQDNVNLGIRACRDQGQLINTGELIRAGIPSWQVSPLYGLLKLYFDQVGFSR